MPLRTLAMKCSPARALLILALQWILWVPVTAPAQTGGTAGDPQRGQQLFLSVGCFECHGTRGAGALPTGPQIAPGPLPWALFLRQLRQPVGSPSYGLMKMPRYGPSLLSDAQIQDIYAYLASIPRGPASSQIPLLQR